MTNEAKTIGTILLVAILAMAFLWWRDSGAKIKRIDELKSSNENILSYVEAIDDIARRALKGDFDDEYTGDGYGFALEEIRSMCEYAGRSN